MLKHDEKRFKGFITLAASESDVDFLERLKAVYAGEGIAQSLDFSAVEQAWLQEEELPLEWRKELASQTPFDLDAYDYWDSYRPPQNLQAALFKGEPAVAWIARGDLLVVLTAPLVRAQTLKHVLHFNGGAAIDPSDTAYDSSLGCGLRNWAQQIALGTGAWLGVSQWLASAGTRPDVIAEAITGDHEPLPYSTLNDFSSLRLLLILVREQLLLGERSADTWIDLLLVNLLNLSRDWSMRQLARPLGLPHHCALPLMKVLDGNPRMNSLLSHADDYGWQPLAPLFGHLSMSVVFARTPGRMQQIIDGMSDQTLSRVYPEEAFSTLFPDDALIYERQRFARCQRVRPLLQTAEAQSWYSSILGQLDGNEFEAVLGRLMLDSDKQRLHRIISEHLVDRETRSFPRELLNQIDTADHLYSYLSANNELLRDLAAYRLFDVATVRQIAEDDERASAYAPHPHNWAVLLKASETYPSLFIRTLSSYGPYRDDLARWELIWNQVEREERSRVAEYFLQSVDDRHYGEQVLDMIERLYAQDSQPWLEHIAEERGYYLDRQIAAISKRDTPLQRLLPAMAARYLMESTSWFTGGGGKDPLSALAGVIRALTAHPDAYAELEEKARIKLLQVFDDAVLVACAESLATLFASNSKLLREPAVALIARSSATAIESSGLLQAAPKARKLVLIGLALSQEPVSLELVSRHFNDKAHDDYSRGLSLDALERAGMPLEGLDPWANIELSVLQAQAQGLKIPAAVSKYWSDEFAAVLAPLGDALGLQLLHILFEGNEQLPRRARQLLGYLPAGRRSDFALLGTQQWIAANGAVEVDWLLLTLPIYGDERIANALVKAIKDWKKVRKQKASAAMRLLCQLPGNFGVSLARDLWESGKFSESIEASAKHALTDAGERQGMTLQEFLEQLVPDFGLTHQGLVLDVGPYSYTVRMLPDLSLAVLDEKGKASKSLPKAKAGEDIDKRSLAENQFKVLSKNLKPVFKQQSKRLTRLFQLGSAWPVGTWQRLFVTHPLMAVIAQSVVWSAEDEQGQPLSRFRPDDGGELVGLDDEPYCLPADVVVHATHPLELDEAERAAWVQHFVDYKLTSPIEQWTTPVLVPSAELLAADRIQLPQDKQLNRGKFGSLVDKWGYIKGQAGDGAQVCEHTWLLDGGRLLVTLNHGDIDVYFDADASVSLGDFEVHRREHDGFERQRLGKLPRAFLNTLLVQAQALTEQAL